MSLRFWQQESRPSRQEASRRAPRIPLTAISVWTHPPLPWEALLHHLRAVEHRTAPDPGLLSHKSLATAAAGIQAITQARWAAATLPRTCYLPLPRLLRSHPPLEDTKCLATLKMLRSLLCIIEVAPCTPPPHHTVPMSRRATPHTPMSGGLGHTWHTTPRCPHHLLPPNTISP